MKTEAEVQNVIDWLGQEDADDPCDDLPWIENVRAFKDALIWVLKDPASEQGVAVDQTICQDQKCGLYPEFCQREKCTLEK